MSVASYKCRSGIRTRTGGGLLLRRQWTFPFHDCGKFLDKPRTYWAPKTVRLSHSHSSGSRRTAEGHVGSTLGRNWSIGLKILHCFDFHLLGTCYVHGERRTRELNAHSCIGYTRSEYTRMTNGEICQLCFQQHLLYRMISHWMLSYMH